LQNPLSHFKLQIQDIDWRSLLPNAFLMMCCWSYVPFAYAIQIKTTVFSHDLYSLFAYQICIALAATIIFDQQGGSLTSIIPLLISFLFAISVFLHGNVFLFILLLLPPCYLLIFELYLHEFQNPVGLLVFGLLMTLSIPVAFTFISVKFLSWSYLLKLIPLLMIYCFYYAPLFLSDDPRFPMIEGSLGVILILTMLTQPIKATLLLAIALVILSWWLLQRLVANPHNQIFYTLLQLLTTILTFWV